MHPADCRATHSLFRHSVLPQHTYMARTVMGMLRLRAMDCGRHGTRKGTPPAARISPTWNRLHPKDAGRTDQHPGMEGSPSSLSTLVRLLALPPQKAEGIGPQHQGVS